MPTPAVDKGRRTFRGRGGATDRNLPPFQARRRKAPRPVGTKVDQIGEPSSHDSSIANTAGEELGGREEGTRTSANDERQVSKVQIDQISEGSEAECESISTPLDSLICEDAKRLPFLFDQRVCREDNNADEAEEPIQKEIRHIERRICNVRESIQLSSGALRNPKTWEENCLNATRNCVHEWRSILLFYGKQDNGDSHLLEFDSELVHETARQAFELVQIAMQSGPLEGSKPGYFKRCGSDVARMALNFLQSVLPEDDTAMNLLFTERQVDAISKWISNAEKVVEACKPPSKSAIRLRTDGKNFSKGKRSKK